MRLILFFDLPMETPQQRKEYARFRKFLVKNGYLMMQKSVYTKLAVDGKMTGVLISRLAKNRPPDGLVQVLQVTEKQFAHMVNITGEEVDCNVVDSVEGLIVL